MATAAQLAANRANSLHSTGPRTPEGKQRSALNSFSHGFSSRIQSVSDEERPAFLELLRELHDSIQPLGGLENELFLMLTGAAWQLRRIARWEESLSAGDANPFLDPEAERRLRSITRYRNAHQRVFDSTLREIRRLQEIRATAAGAEAEAETIETPLALLLKHTRPVQNEADREVFSESYASCAPENPSADTRPAYMAS